VNSSIDFAYTMDLDAIELRRLLDRCPKRDRVLLERSLQGYSAEEIARTAGITSTGIRVRLLRVRQALRGQMAAVAA
jgi:DNA-directed RNA polymerase specialized sigma24 family protein